MNVIQEIINGIPECPILIESDHYAMMKFAELAKQHGVIVDEDDLATYEDKIIKNLIDNVREQLSGSGVELHWWDTEYEPISEDDDPDDIPEELFRSPSLNK